MISFVSLIVTLSQAEEMMKFTSIKTGETIDCGKLVCLTANGSGCSFLAARHNGQEAVCRRRFKDDDVTPLKKRNGYILRSEACLSLFSEPVD